MDQPVDAVRVGGRQGQRDAALEQNPGPTDRDFRGAALLEAAVADALDEAAGQDLEEVERQGRVVDV